MDIESIKPADQAVIHYARNGGSDPRHSARVECLSCRVVFTTLLDSKPANFGRHTVAVVPCAECSRVMREPDAPGYHKDHRAVHRHVRVLECDGESYAG